MKKSKQAPSSPKEKPFTTSPFKALKALKKEEPAAKQAQNKPEKPKEEPAAPPAEADDSILFLREMADVARLQPSSGRQDKSAPAPEPVRRPAVEPEERKVFLEALQQLDVRFEDELPDDVEPLREVHSSRMKRLKRGALRIEEQIDLHGLTKEEAIDSLKRFIAAAFRRQRQAVLVITGKGNKSPAEPVLQGAVAAWLRNEGKSAVAEFSPAPAKLGGNGAFVVFLREPRPENV